MAYAQQKASRTQTTKVAVPTGSWVRMEGTTPLTNRFATKVFNAGSGGATRLVLAYNDGSGSPKDGSHFLGAGQFVVEPNDTGLTLYGRAKGASGINSIRVFVTEYGS